MTTTLQALLTATVLVLYYLTLGVLAIYGVHRLALVVVYWRTRRQEHGVPPPPMEWPRVTVQLPLYNEMYVSPRLIDAVARLDYPADRLEIQVLDDSTDETTALVAERVAFWRHHGLAIHHLRRSERTGFKAGALAAGLEVATGDLIAIFDADFLPAADFLRRTVPQLAADPGLGMVQARWSHLNRNYSLLTRVQAVLLDGHFLIEHAARNRGGCFFNFNGTAGVWRREAISSAGGWQHDTVTEDLDLSYRAQLIGWRFLYLPDVDVPAELPVDINGFKSQQARWAKGAIQTGRKLLGRILRAPLPWSVRLEALVHLTNNASYFLLVLLSLLVWPAMLLRAENSLGLVLMVDLPLFLAATISVFAFYGSSQIARGGGGLKQCWLMPALMGLGIGMAVSNAPAVLAGWRSLGGVFHRTPKYAIAHRGEDWVSKRYRSLMSPAVLVEGLAATYFGVCVVWAASAGMWLSIPFLYLFLQGYSYVFCLSLGGALRTFVPGAPAVATRRT